MQGSRRRIVLYYAFLTVGLLSVGVFSYGMTDRRAHAPQTADISRFRVVSGSQAHFEPKLKSTSLPVESEATSTLTVTSSQPEIAPAVLGTSFATVTGPQNFIVRFVDGDGYVPAELTVGVGDTVTFLNESRLPTRPASDPHESHADYPEPGGCIGSAFDACRSVQSYGTWPFKFNYRGSWHYHDHVNPVFHGVINVR